MVTATVSSQLLEVHCNKNIQKQTVDHSIRSTTNKYFANYNMIQGRHYATATVTFPTHSFKGTKVNSSQNFPSITDLHELELSTLHCHTVLEHQFWLFSNNELHVWVAQLIML